MSKKIADVATKLVTTLEPLDRDERRRAIDAALVILGDPRQGVKGGGNAGDARDRQEEDDGHDTGEWPSHTKFRTWLRQNKITEGQLAQLFHLEAGKVSVIASTVSGGKGGVKSRNAYLLCGLAALIASGEPEFTDDDARTLCRNLGCYDQNNHSNYLNAMGNKVTGSKKSGWKLTSPGLTAAAEVVKETTGDKQ